MTLSRPAIRLFAALLHDHIQHEGEAVDRYDEEVSAHIFRINKIGHNQFNDRIIDQEKRAELWAIADRESDSLDLKLAEWRYQRWYLEQFLRQLQNELRRPHAAAA